MSNESLMKQSEAIDDLINFKLYHDDPNLCKWGGKPSVVGCLPQITDYPSKERPDLCTIMLAPVVLRAEWDKFLIWVDGQMAKKQGFGCDGGRFTFKVNPTSVGNYVVAYDDWLNEQYEITDPSNF